MTHILYRKESTALTWAPGVRNVKGTTMSHSNKFIKPYVVHHPRKVKRLKQTNGRSGRENDEYEIPTCKIFAAKA